MIQTVELVETPAGDPAWHIGRYPQVKALLADQRLGRAHPDPARASWYSREDVAGRPARGAESEYADHAGWRKAMNKVFSPSGLERMIPAVRTVAVQVADEMAAATPPADLNDTFAIPLTSRVMCTLLGIPAEDIDRFRAWTEEGAHDDDMARSAAGMKMLMSYVSSLIARRRADPGPDVVSVLVANGGDGSRGYLGRVVKLLGGMLAFGRETPASVINWGAMLLLTNTSQRDLLSREPSLMNRAMEEILRLFKPHAATDLGLVRYAHADITVGETTIRAGDMVLLDVMLANRDSDVFPDPDRFDIARDPNPHLTFGSGFYMCNFTKLGRAEISIGLTTLLSRFPGLQMAGEVSELKYKEHMRTGGLAGLPVTW
jgi:pentalenolactone synthase